MLRVYFFIHIVRTDGNGNGADGSATNILSIDPASHDQTNTVSTLRVLFGHRTDCIIKNSNSLKPQARAAVVLHS